MLRPISCTGHMVLIRKNKSDVLHLKQNLNIKNLGQNLYVYFNKKLISHCIILKQIYLFIEMVICVAVDQGTKIWNSNGS